MVKRMKMINHIYEHLKTRKKYNTLQVKYDVKCDELEEKIIQYNTEKKTKLLQRDLYEQRIKDLTESNIDLHQEIIQLKKEIKELKKEGKYGTRNTESKTRTKKTKKRKTKS